MPVLLGLSLLHTARALHRKSWPFSAWVTPSLEEESGDHWTSSLKTGEAFRANGLIRKGPGQADPTKDICRSSPGEDNEGHQVEALEFKGHNAAEGTGAEEAD